MKKNKTLIPLIASVSAVTPICVLTSCNNNYGVTYVKDIKAHLEGELSVWRIYVDIVYTKGVSEMSPSYHEFEFKEGSPNVRLIDRLSYPSKTWSMDIGATFSDGTATTFTIKVEYSLNSSSAKILSIRVEEKI